MMREQHQGKGEGDGMQALVYQIDDRRFGIALSAVERTIRAVAVTPVLDAPASILGIINVQGRVIPVVNTREKLHLPPRELALSDQFIIAHTATKRTLALVVDSVSGVAAYSADEVPTGREIDPGLKYLQAVIRLRDGMVLIYDLARFLGSEEEASLSDALADN